MTDAFAGSPHLLGPNRFVLRVPADTAYLAVAREFVATAAAEQGFPHGEVAKAVMAVDEACVNVIEHAYRPDEPLASRLLEVAIEADPTRLLVTVADRAQAPFSPLDHPAPDLEGFLAAGRRKGLGILILRTFMDDVSHSYHPGRGNELRLVKYASPQASSPSPL